MQYQLIAFDLDGTLLDNQKHIPPDNLAALHAAAEKGVVIVPATGRLEKGIPAELRALPFIRYCIAINGATVVDRKTGAELYASTIPPELTLELYDRLAGYEAIPDVYQFNQGWVSEKYFSVAEEYIPDAAMRRVYMAQRQPVAELRALLTERNAPAQKVSAFFKDMVLRKRVMAELAADYPQLQVTSSIPNNVEINSGGADKGRALKALCAHLGIPREASIAFGDGGNDATMLQAAGMGVAMENAAPGLKAKAAMVTCSNNEAGVAAALKRLGVV